MAIPIELAEDAAAALTKTSLGRSVIQEAEHLARSRLMHEAGADLLGGHTESLLSARQAPASALFHPRSLDAIINAFPEEIPASLDPTIARLAEPGKIGSVLNPQVDQKLGIGVHKLSQQWSKLPDFHGSKLILGTPTGEATLPEMLLSTDGAGKTAMAGWFNGKVYMGESAFEKPFSSETAGIVVHETTHHEQALLALCLAADRLGIRTAEDAAAKFPQLVSDLAPYHVGLRSETMQKFLDFRAGRELTSEAAARAEQILQSNRELFSLPFHPEKLTRQIDEIGKVKNLISSGVDDNVAAEALKELTDPAQRESVLERLIGRAAGKPEQLLKLRLDADLDEAALRFDDSWQTHLTDDLQEAQKLAETNKQTWLAVYKDALHEREARFNQFVAQESVADHLLSLH
jgi:hypothetical protein